eukprot:8862487-Pyramimonas_sp.AAC.2
MAMEDAKMSKSNIQVLYVDFVDAFGNVDHTRLRHVMRAMGVPKGLIEVVQDLYEGASIVVCTPAGDTRPIPIMGRGTIQGDALSPLLFILYIEPLLRWLAEDQHACSFKTSDQRVGPLAYADDLASVTGTGEQALAHTG